MLDKLDCTQLCPDCKTIRTSRSRHCMICKHCVERFDHHCPWINNCVGVRNHNYFLMYVLFETLLLVITFSYGGIALNGLIRDGGLEKVWLPLVQLNDYWTILDFVFILLLVLTTLFFTIGVLPLSFFQIKNFVNGKTTNELYSRGNDQDRQTLILNSGI